MAADIYGINQAARWRSLGRDWPGKSARAFGANVFTLGAIHVHHHHHLSLKATGALVSGGGGSERGAKRARDRPAEGARRWLGRELGLAGQEAEPSWLPNLRSINLRPKLAAGSLSAPLLAERRSKVNFGRREKGAPGNRFGCSAERSATNGRAAVKSAPSIACLEPRGHLPSGGQTAVLIKAAARCTRAAKVRAREWRRKSARLVGKFLVC